MRNYQCAKCGVSIKSNTSPSPSGCPKGGFHQWFDLGEVGNDNYQCKKCGTLVQSKSHPSPSGCPNGGFHQWNKL